MTGAIQREDAFVITLYLLDLPITPTGMMAELALCADFRAGESCSSIT